MNSGSRGRWDRNRTCNLRFWSTRRAVQGRLTLSNTALNSLFLATHRPAPSKNVQPLCSQFCSQGPFESSTLGGHQLSTLKFANVPEAHRRKWQERGRSVATTHSIFDWTPSREQVIFCRKFWCLCASNRPILVRSVRLVCWRFCWQGKHMRLKQSGALILPGHSQGGRSSVAKRPRRRVAPSTGALRSRDAC